MPRKNNSTPIPSEGSTMTHEAEEWQHDISKLQEKVQQIFLSQRETKNERDVLKKGMEANMNSLESKMDGTKVGMEAKMDDMEAKIDEKMKENMENMKNDLKLDIEGLENLIQ